MAGGNIYYVSNSGSDSGRGTVGEPFRTIQKAADTMYPGDTCIIRGGVYREQVMPPRGGDSETQRITYMAAKGEEAVIKGSEQISCWTRYEGDVWKAELPDDFFGSFNPYKTNVSGGWLLFGHRYHLGEVYLNGVPYCEKLYLREVSASPETWYTESSGNLTVIYANFGGADPNAALAEINVRECVLFPVKKGLRYITLDGLCFMQAAANWVNFTDFQHAAVGTYYGKNWIIQNCRISDAKCAGLVCGNDPSGYNEGFDIEETGHHIVRNNWICRCGEAGIHGYKGWAASLIEGNLIEDINTRKHFGGYESAGMKIHHAVDVTVKNNIVRRVGAGIGGQYAGIWIDWGAQGTRVTGNIVYDMHEWNGWAFFIQNSHCGPVLADNNIFAGQIYNTARNTVFAHNLFIDSRWYFMVENMDPVYWKPHTAEVVEILPLTHLEGDRYYNNIFARKGADQIVNAHGYKIDWNVYYGGARKSGLGENHSIVSNEHDADVKIESDRSSAPGEARGKARGGACGGVKITLTADNAPYDVKCPLITYDFIGTYALTGQGLEDHCGNPVNVDTGIFGNPRSGSRNAAGPFEDIKPGENTFTFRAGPR